MASRRSRLDCGVHMANGSVTDYVPDWRDNSQLHVTVCVCTRERADSLTRALRSIAASHYRPFDVLVVDQSVSEASRTVVRELLATLPPFPVLHIPSTTTGAAAAHNTAAQHAHGDIIAFTDDDCEVAPDWLTTIVRYFEAHPTVAQLCGAVHAGPHDAAAGFIPTYTMHAERQIASPWLKWRESGIGANMAFRRDALRSVGMFDELLGTGAPLHACLDGDMTYRMLKAGYTVASVPEVCVIHHGFRTWDQGRTLMRHCGYGVAAAYTKHLRLGDVAVLPTLVIEWLRCIHWPGLVRAGSRIGVRRFLAYARGMSASFRYPIDKRTRTYRASYILAHVEGTLSQQQGKCHLSSPYRAQGHEFNGRTS